MAKIIKPGESLGAQAIVTTEDAYDKRKEAFIREVDKAGDSYLIGIAPRLAYTNEGVLPVLAFIDRKANPQAPEKTQKKN